MRKKLYLNKLVILCLASFLMTSPKIFAESDYEPAGDTEKTDQKLSENVIVDEMLDKMAQEDGDPKLGRQSLRVITLKATGKKIYVPLWYNNSSNPEKNLDPLRPKIEKEVVLPPSRPTPPPQQPKTKTEPPKKIIPPLKIFVKGIVCNEGVRFAVIDFENEERTIVKNQIVDGKFKVVDIYSDRIVVYSNAEQRRYTFKIGGEEK